MACVILGYKLKVDISETWRDKIVAGEILSEVKRQSLQGWRPWELLLPPELLWPMFEEISKGMFEVWSPVFHGIAVQVGDPAEVSIRFILPDMKTSPVMVKSMPYHGNRSGDTVPVEVHCGNKV